MRTIRWGVLGPGSIARKFCAGLADLPDTELVAVGSRNNPSSIESANKFADDFNVETRHDSYEKLVNDPNVDVIYIATPHSFHSEHSLLCLNAGKAVLCEKPFSINATQTQEVISLAQEKNLFVMEAVWTLFLPHMVKIRELIESGSIGEVRMVQADFGFRTGVNPEGRLFDKNLGGGALLDVGIYPILLALDLLGPATEIKSMATIGTTGVDEEASIIMRHSKGEQSLLSTAIRLNTPHEATILGTEGRIHIHGSWWQPTSFTLYQDGKDSVLFDIETLDNGYNYEALEVNNCLRDGKAESAIMPLSKTLELTQTLDTIRSQWGLQYPMETS